MSESKLEIRNVVCSAGRYTHPSHFAKQTYHPHRFHPSLLPRRCEAHIIHSEHLSIKPNLLFLFYLVLSWALKSKGTLCESFLAL